MVDRSLLEFRKKFKKFFPTLNPNEYLDVIFWQASRSVKIDVVKLDEWLHIKIGDYEVQKNWSMSMALEKTFGKEASLFVKSYL